MLKDLQINLRAGMRLALFRRCALSDFRISLDQLVVLLILDLFIANAADFIRAVPEPLFVSYALPVFVLLQASFFLVLFVIAKLARDNEFVLRLGVVAYSTVPLTAALEFAGKSLENRKNEMPWAIWAMWAIFLYVYGVFYRGIALSLRKRRLATFVALLLIVISVTIPALYYQRYSHFWYAASNDDDDDDEENDRWAAYRAIDAEALMYRQPALLDQQLAALKPQREQVSDIYFVGFASYAQQDVFSKEIAFARRLMDQRFDTQGHSINLVNHLSTKEDTPLATETNLRQTLRQIGRQMNRADDVLVLYLTSHGSKEHELSVQFWPLGLNDITPTKLKSMLDEAGIQWRVIIVSACYSGGFIKPLENDHTLIASAAAADRTSFGCGNAFEFTYFGEALFKDQLSHQDSIIAALQAADAAIGEREKREKLEPSKPQLSVGKAIGAKLDKLAEGISKRRLPIKLEVGSLDKAAAHPSSP